MLCLLPLLFLPLLMVSLLPWGFGGCAPYPYVVPVHRCACHQEPPRPAPPTADPVRRAH
jgi:hypothetical protein